MLRNSQTCICSGIPRRTWRLALLCCTIASQARFAIGQEQGASAQSNPLKSLTFDELFDVEVTSVSRRPERISDAASAIQVITQDDIRRSGATCIPEALRLASNLQVARIDSHQWAITARGFNSSSANKLLVMIDGRTVYTPLYSGIFWDVQDTLMEDIDRIEVVSGPGATLWGANAVNGVINIITKKTAQTKGTFLTGEAGSVLRDSMGFRYGGSDGKGMDYRVYGKLFERDAAPLANGHSAGDAWPMKQGGFRMDSSRSGADNLTFQGDLYDGRIGITTLSGGNALGRYTHTISKESNVTAQLYFDRTHRNAPGIFSENLDTVDLDVQHRFPMGRGHDVVWGFGYRRTMDDVTNSTILAFLPAKLTQQLFSGFAQDEITLQKDWLHLTVGAKVEHNDYTGLEFQPSVRLAKNVSPHETAWAAISRAVRMPSRFDRDLFIPGTPPFLLDGGANFQSETVVAYEAGYRSRPTPKISWSLAAYFNDYDRLRSGEQINPPAPLPLAVGNGFRGQSWGGELSMDYQASEDWRLKLGYTHLKNHFWAKPGSTDLSNGASLASDPTDVVSLRSSWDLPNNFGLDAMFRYYSGIANQNVPAYAELDLHLAWSPKPGLEVAFTGQNLLHPQHAEFGAPNGRQYVGRAVFGSITWRF